ncbi:hypothetical protein V5O48_015273 [Marasmius crinis-equi]|uniref:F-box domain-containing protein n=1 Tax=Marasmius crinis-equi TaxID=585013 RepID=A0ABR3EV03_9AGAR
MSAITSEAGLRTSLCDQCNADLVRPCYPEITMDHFRHHPFPSDADVSTHAAYIELEKHALERYDKEIERLQSTVQKLRDNRALLRQQMNRRRYFISSQRKLPIELWTEILLEACYRKTTSRSSDPFVPVSDIIIPYRISLTPSEFHRSRIPPLSLSRTCYLWEKIISNTPAFWSCVEIELSHRPPSVQVLRTLETFFSKSREAPLTLKLSSTLSFVNHPSPDAAKDTLIILRHNLTRAQSLDVEMFSLCELLRYGELSMPLLEKFILHGNGWVGAPHETQVLRAGNLIVPPSLASLSVDSMHVLINQTLLRDPSPALTTFECWEEIANSQLPVIRVACPRLQVLKISVEDEEQNGTTGTWPENWAPSTIHTLHINIPRTDPSAVIESLTTTTPFLCNLDLCLPYWPEPEEAFERIIHPFTAFLRRSGRNLESLGFSCFADLPAVDDSTWLSEILLLLPRLKTLRFATTVFNKGVRLSPLHRLTSLLTVASGEQVTLLPNVHTLVARVSWYPEYHAADAVHMAQKFTSLVESRSRSDCVLKRSELIISNDDSDWYHWRDEHEDLSDLALDLMRRQDGLLEKGITCSIKGIETPID